MTQVLHEEISPDGLRAQVVCPGVVATEFHERQGLDLSAVPRMSAEDVVIASLLDAVSQASLAAFGAQSPALAQRYRASGP